MCKPSTSTVPPLPLSQCLLGGPRASAWSQGLSGPSGLQSGPHSATPPLSSENEGSTGEDLNFGDEGKSRANGGTYSWTYSQVA